LTKIAGDPEKGISASITTRATDRWVIRKIEEENLYFFGKIYLFVEHR
jgi:hypothetical protein